MLLTSIPANAQISSIMVFSSKRFPIDSPLDISPNVTIRTASTSAGFRKCSRMSF